MALLAHASILVCHIWISKSVCFNMEILEKAFKVLTIGQKEWQNSVNKNSKTVSSKTQAGVIEVQ